MSDVKRVGVFADTHVGSEYGLAPYGFKIGEGPKKRTIGISEEQKYLLKLFRATYRAMGKLHALVLNGDIVDGLNEKNKGKNLLVSDFYIQAEMAAALFKEVIDYCKPEHIYATKGSKYHIGENINIDELVCKQIGGKFRASWPLTVDGVKFHFSHLIGYSASVYRSSAGNRELIMSELNKESLGHYQVLVRSHTHYFYDQGSANRHLYITPCFKSRDDFAETKGLSMCPDVGGLWFDVDGDSWRPDWAVEHLPQSLLMPEERI